MARRLRDEIRHSKLPVDRMTSYQGEEILKSYNHGRYYFDESTGIHWMIEQETPAGFLARLFRSEDDDSIIVVERREGLVRSYKYGNDQSHPISLGAGSPEFVLLESKIRYPELLTRPYLWRQLAS